MYTVEVTEDSISFRYSHNKHKYLLHREDGPAIIYSNGDTQWYLDGFRHRLDGPAKDYESKREWIQYGIHNRLDGPAVEYQDGTKDWIQDGVLHRLDGPAVIFSNGDTRWYVFSKLHREDGPAVERLDGYKEYWLCGRQYTINEYYSLLKLGIP